MEPICFVFMLFFLEQVLAVSICNEEHIKVVQQQPKLMEKPSLTLIEKQSFWLISMTKEDISSFDAKSIEVKVGQYDSTTNSIKCKVAMFKEDGKIQIIPYLASAKDSFFLEQQFDGDYHSYSFRCSDIVLGSYRCLTDHSDRGNKPMLSVFASTNFTKADITDEELKSCKEKLKLIDPSAEFVDLNYPDKQLTSCEQTTFNYKDTFFC